MLPLHLIASQDFYTLAINGIGTQRINVEGIGC